MMRRFALVFVALMAAAAPSAFAQISDPSAKIADYLSAVAFSGDRSAANALADRLYDETVTVDQWRRDFQKYFTTGAFTEALGAFWETVLIEADDREHPRLGLISALCASEAAKAALPRAAQLPAAYDSLATASVTESAHGGKIHRGNRLADRPT